MSVIAFRKSKNDVEVPAETGDVPALPGPAESEGAFDFGLRRPILLGSAIDGVFSVEFGTWAPSRRCRAP